MQNNNNNNAGLKPTVVKLHSLPVRGHGHDQAGSEQVDVGDVGEAHVDGTRPDRKVFVDAFQKDDPVQPDPGRLRFGRKLRSRKNDRDDALLLRFDALRCREHQIEKDFHLPRRSKRETGMDEKCYQHTHITHAHKTKTKDTGKRTRIVRGVVRLNPPTTVKTRLPLRSR